MTFSRRHFLATTAAATLTPATLRAAAHGDNSFANGAITVHPIAHASIVLETPAGTLYVDPVGDPAQYADFPNPDLILITHEHGDHFKPDTLGAIAGDTPLLTNPAVHGKLASDLAANASSVANGGSHQFANATIDAIPAYNHSADRLKFHPEGRDNGYVLTIDGFRIYISGDTEDIAEMRALSGIDLAFVCMNLPFTMDAEAAASAVNEFKPAVVYPYHYRGRDGGTQDPKEFAALLTDVDVRFGDWYG